MQAKINEKSKILEIWLTGSDQHDEACTAQVSSLISQWHDKSWTPVIYKSGKEDLAEFTSALLVTNRNRAARRNVEQQRTAKEGSKHPVIETLQRKPEPVKNTARQKRDDTSL